MGRLKGSTNINSSSTPVTLTLKPSERISFLANLIIDRIIEDQRKGSSIVKTVPPK